MENWTLEDYEWRWSSRSPIGPSLAYQELERTLGAIKTQGNMKTYLLTWNPEKWKWDSADIQKAIAELDSGQSMVMEWSCGNTRRIQPGDRLVWIRLGSLPRGVFATGVARSEVVDRPHWDKHRAAQGDTSKGVMVEFVELVSGCHRLTFSLFTGGAVQTCAVSLP